MSTTDRYGHHKDPWFKEMCERAAGWLTAAAGPSAIDNYSLEKISQVKGLLPELRDHVRNTTGVVDERTNVVRLEALARAQGWTCRVSPESRTEPRAKASLRVNGVLLEAEAYDSLTAAGDLLAALDRIGRAS